MEDITIKEDRFFDIENKIQLNLFNPKCKQNLELEANYIDENNPDYNLHRSLSQNSFQDVEQENKMLKRQRTSEQIQDQNLQQNVGNGSKVRVLNSSKVLFQNNESQGSQPDSIKNHHQQDQQKQNINNNNLKIKRQNSKMGDIKITEFFNRSKKNSKSNNSMQQDLPQQENNNLLFQQQDQQKENNNNNANNNSNTNNSSNNSSYKQQEMEEINNKLLQKIKEQEELLQKKNQECQGFEQENKKLKDQLMNNKSQIDQFRNKVSKTFQKCILEKEKLAKEDRKQKNLQLKQRLGEFTSIREGTKFVDVWLDGQEIKHTKERLAQIQKEKADYENKKKNLKVLNPKKKLGFFQGTQQVQQQNSCGSNQSTNIDNSNASFEKNNSSSFHSIYSLNLNIGDEELNDDQIQNQKELEEIKKRLSFQICMLQKEEHTLNETLAKLDNEKYVFIKDLMLQKEEDHCKFSQHLPVLGKKYQILGLLGKGGFSEVYRSYDLTNLRDVAVKIHQLNPNWSEVSKSNYIMHAIREGDVQRYLNHPNIVKLYDTIEIDQSTYGTVQEFCEGPDLSFYLKKYKTFNENNAKLIIKQILAGLAYMNSTKHKIIHYDLKPQNIMFHKGEVKITDFGLCKIMNDNQTRMELTSQGVGTYWYLPPECFLIDDQALISTKVDIWSVGIILYEMLFGMKPFGNKMSQEQIMKEQVILNSKKVVFPNKPSISDDCKDFIKKCLSHDQKQRMDITQATNHQFISGNNKLFQKNNSKNNN